MGLIWGEFESHSCSADSRPQGKEENETFSEKQEKRSENRFRPEKSPTGTKKGGTKLSAIKKHAIKILDQNPEPTRKALSLSVESGRDRFGLDPNSGGPCCRFKSARAQKWRRCWSEGQSNTDAALWAFTVRVSRVRFVFLFLFALNPKNRENERERGGARGCEVSALKALVCELFTCTDLADYVNSAVLNQESCVSVVNIQRSPNLDQHRSSFHELSLTWHVWSSRSHTGEFIPTPLSVYHLIF